MTHDYRDAVIETLAESEAALRDRVDDLTVRLENAERQRDSYRLVAVQAIYRLCALRAESDTTTERYHRAPEDARGLRVQLVERAA